MENKAAPTPWTVRLRGLRQELSDGLQYIALPALVALLPWRLGFRLLRALSAWPWLYRQRGETAVAAASRMGFVADPRSWLRKHRLMMLTDQTDLYLSRWRGNRWLQRHVDVSGQWGAQGQAALLVTFHWAAGMWAHRHARASGLASRMLLARQEGGGYAGHRLLRCYGRWRAAEVARANGAPVIFVPGAMAEIRGALQQGHQVTVVLDVPPDQVGRTQPQAVLGRTAHMPVALQQLAVEMQIPVTVFWLGLDTRSGRRDLHLQPLGQWSDADALSRRIFACFDDIVRAQPAYWHFWAVADRFFAD